MAITKVLQEYDDEYILSQLEEEVRRWFKKEFKAFTPPQKYGVIEILNKNNILISSPTGSGKTLAAFLSIINHLVKLSKENSLENRIYAIYISPLRSLNNDIKRNLRKPLKGIEKIAKKEFGIRIGVRTSDTTSYEKSKMLKEAPHILITTPESFSISLNTLKFSQLMANTEYIIVDEVHALANNKRGVSLSLGLERLSYIKGDDFVRIGLSATIHPLTEVAKFLVGNGRDCKIVDVNYMKKTILEVKSPVDDFIYTPPETINKKLYEMIDKLVEQHRTTLIFTNTRSATERVVFHLKQHFGDKYVDNISAHHSSLGRNIRLETEEKLKRGELKVVVSSTSLELGIDIGNIDLVILLGSPKSVSRTLQRVGRSGHRLHEESKGILIPLDRDDLMEVTLIAHHARKRKFDKIRIPNKPLDVLTQHVLGMALQKKWKIKEALSVIKRAYPYRNLTKEELVSILKYLAGEYSELESRKIYGKIWFENEEFGKRGKMSRVIYFMNSGTIPEESTVPVFHKSTKKFIGKLEEEFVERLVIGDVFVLGGKTYVFVGSRGNKIYVESGEGLKPTIPSWFSEMLPLSYEIALGLEKFRDELRKSSISSITKTYKIDESAAQALINYVKEQEKYSIVPNPKEFLVEEYIDSEGLKNYIFHACAGRKANEALARAFAHYIGKKKQANVRVSLNDQGFMLTVGRWRRVGENEIKELINMGKETFMQNLKEAVEGSELLKRRFREVGVRSLLILRKYPGREMSLNRQQTNADNLLKLIKFYYKDFPVLKETYREIFEDVMHVDEALDYLERLKKRTLVFKRNLTLPSPFAFNLVATGAKDVIMMEDKREFIRRLHQKLMERLKNEVY